MQTATGANQAISIYGTTRSVTICVHFESARINIAQFGLGKTIVT